MYPLIQKIETIPIKRILSAMGSNTFPKSVRQLKVRARKPSSASVSAAIRKRPSETKYSSM